MANPIQLLMLGGLVGTLAWGGLEFTRDNQTLPPAPTAANEAPLQATPLPDLQPPPIEDYAVVTERPLFFSDRKLPAKTDSGSNPLAGKKRKARGGSGKAPELKVTGIFLEAEQSSALVEILASGNNRKLLMGETVAGWKLVEIDDLAITLQSGRNRQKYPLHQFDDPASRKGKRRATPKRPVTPKGAPPAIPPATPGPVRR